MFYTQIFFPPQLLNFKYEFFKFSVMFVLEIYIPFCIFIWYNKNMNIYYNFMYYDNEHGNKIDGAINKGC